MLPRGLKDWEEAASKGDFSKLPDPLRWSQSARLAHLIDGYEEAGGFNALGRLANSRWEAAHDLGIWRGSVRDLWLCLFFEHRRARHCGYGPAEDDLQLLNSLCEALRTALQNLSKAEARAFSTRLTGYPG